MSASSPREPEARVGAPLGDLGAADLAELAAAAAPFRVSEGALFRQGDVADAMYVLEDGEVELSVRTPGDDVMMLGRATAGAVFGELSLIDLGVRSATASVTKPASGWRLGRGAFDALRAARRPAGAALLAHLGAVTCSRIRARVADLAATLDRAAPPVFAARACVEQDRWQRLPPLSVEPRAAAMLPFFAALSAGARAALCDRGAAFAVHRGERLTTAGVSAGGLLVVVRGAALTWVERDGLRERCGVVGPGRVVSVVAAMDGGPAALDAAAREDAVLLSLDDAVLAELRTSRELRHELDEVLVRELAGELRRVTAELARLAAHGRFPSGR